MRKTYKSLRQNMRVFLLFEIQFRIILVFLFSEGLSRIIDFLLRFQGYSYVTQGNYVRFLKHPVTVIGLLAVLLLFLLMILYECCGLFLLFDAGNRGMKVSLAQLYQMSAVQTASVLKKYPVRWIGIMLLCVSNLYLHLLFWEVERARFIDIVAGDIVEKVGIFPVAAVLVIYLFASMIYSLNLPFRIFQKQTPFAAGLIDFSSRRKKQLKSVAASLYLNLRVFLGTGILFMLAVFISVFLIRTFRPVTRYVSDVLFYGSILKLVTGLLIGFFGTVTMTGYLYHMFRETQETGICWEKPQPVLRPMLTKSLVLFLSGVILIFEGATFIPNTAGTQDYLEITAHRGGAKFAPENTLAAIQYSIDTKSDYAEIDVQETKDGEIILLHDNWLGRTTGLKKYVWDTTYEEIQELDAGSSFSSRFAGEKIPTLRECIQASHGKLRLNIEIKSNGHNDDIVEKVVAIIQEENFISNCVITSMNYSMLKEVKELCPELTTGYTLRMVYGSVEDMSAADFYSVKYTYVSRRLVLKVHEMGKQICAWTTNTRTSIRQMIDVGVDNVITDNPELVRKELLGEYDVVPGFISLVKYMVMQ